MLAILTQLRLTRQIRDIRPGIRFRDGETYPLVTVQDARQDALDEFLLPELDERGAADAEAADQVLD